MRGASSFPTADRLGTGAGEGALSAVIEIDGDGVLSDMNGHDVVGVAAPEGEFWPATMMTPVADSRRCTVTGSIESRGGGPAGRAPR